MLLNPEPVSRAECFRHEALACLYFLYSLRSLWLQQ